LFAKLLTAKVAAIAAVIVLGAATAVAATTGSLPTVAHHGNSHATQHSDATETESAGGATAGTNAAGPAAATNEGNGPSEHALFGLCTAQAASDGHPAISSTVASADCSNPPPHPGNKGGVSAQHSQAPATNGPTSATQGSSADHRQDGGSHGPAATSTGETESEQHSTGPDDNANDHARNHG